MVTRKLLSLLLVLFCAGASAQQLVNCAPGIPCDPVLGPSGTGTGDPSWKAFGKLNADLSSLPFQLFNNTPLPVNKGGTGAITVTGPLKGNGTSAISPALAADIYGLWTGTCNATTFLRGDGSCQTAGGNSAFNTLTSGVNNSAAMVIDTGASLGATNLGTIAATSLSSLTGLPSVAAQTILGNGGAVSAAPAALSLTCNLSATSTTLGINRVINAQTGTNYPVTPTDACKLLTFSNASPIAVPLPQAGTLPNGFTFDVQNLGAGLVTLTPTAPSTINGQPSLTVSTNTGCTVSGDSVNFQVSSCTALLVSSPFIPGAFTSTQVINSFSPATHGGSSVLTTDFGLLTGDGVRWVVDQATPPIPPGAAILGYVHNAYTIFPVLADISNTSSAAIPSRFYNGVTILASSNPPMTGYSLASNGQIKLTYVGGDPLGNGPSFSPMRNLNSLPVQGNLGYMPFLLGSRGFCVEEAITISGNNTDNFFAFYVEPQEHNTTQNDHISTDPVQYERWLELDVNENGHGTDFGGGNRGAVHSWEGRFNGPLLFTANPSGTSGTLGVSALTNASGQWQGGTRTDWTIKFASGASGTAAHLTNGSSAVTWTGSVSESAATATVSFANTQVSNVVVTAIDYTTEHIFTGCLDPVGQTWALWQDGVLQNTLAIPAGTNPGVYNWHYFPLWYLRPHGSLVGFSANIRYVSAWVP